MEYTAENTGPTVQYLLSAPDSQLDAKMRPLIETWDAPPTPLQILRVLDLCIYAALASGFVVRVLQILYDDACKASTTTHEQVAQQAPWREDIRLAMP